jgi:hypothetical protein
MSSEVKLVKAKFEMLVFFNCFGWYEAQQVQNAFFSDNNKNNNYNNKNCCGQVSVLLCIADILLAR